MPYTTPAAITTGTVISKSTFGDVVINDLNFLAGAPSCRVYHNTTQSLADGVETTVAFNSERHDNDVMHDLVTNNSRITIKTAGVYVVGALLEVAGAADYASLYASLRVNGATSIDEVLILNHNNAGFTPHLKLVTVYKFALNDYVEVRAFQDNTANVARNIVANPNRSPEFWANWVSLG